MKQSVAFLIIAVFATSAVIVPLAVFFILDKDPGLEDGLLFGVTYGQDTVEGAKILIDRVYTYTNIFIVDSSDVSNNKTKLDSVCNYAAEKNLSFIVYFFSLFAYDWQREWVVTANQTWGEKFLGVYLRDEPGGRQIELAETVPNASSYGEAAESYVRTVSSTPSMVFLKNNSIPVVTSDFALYWFDYKAGFDVIFAQLGWNNSRIQEIGLCRGAATAHGKDWGSIITWTYQQPPYLENGPKIYKDMATAYKAGAKYILLFNYPQFPENNQYGILEDGHFLAMEQFWNYAKTHPRDLTKTEGEVALVLPKDYGWGMRRPNDSIWGLWPTDNDSALIWQNLNAFTEKYGLKLDIVYDDEKVFTKDYSEQYLWNQTINYESWQ